MNILFIIIPLVLVGIGTSVYFVTAKKSPKPPKDDKNRAVKLIINVGKIESRV